MTKRIPLSGERGAGRFVLVDDADFEWLSRYRWHFAARPSKSNPERGYAARGIQKKGKAILILMHREILQLSKGEQCDHVDGNGLNNTHANLRKATSAQNGRNQGSRPIWGDEPTSSVYKGVRFNRRPGRRKRWFASIVVNRVTISLGYYHTEVEAATAYDNGARRLHGDFAKLNFPDNQNK